MNKITSFLRRIFTDDLIMVTPIVGFLYALGVFFIYPVFNDFKQKEGFLDDTRRGIFWVSILIQGYSLLALTNMLSCG